MEIKVSSISFVNTLTKYAVTRLVTARIVALAALVTIVSIALSAHRTFWDIGTTALLAGCLISQFRLWDDLEDRNFDRVHHPHRILAISDEVNQFYLVVIGLGMLVTIGLAIWRSLTQLLVYGLLLLGFTVFYRLPTWHDTKRLLRTQLVLIKYPVFLYLCAQQTIFNKLVLSALALYVFLSLIDLLSDDALRPLPMRRWLLLIESTAFSIILAIIIWSMKD